MLNWTADQDSAVVVNAPSRAAFLDDISTRMDQGRGFTVATLNLDHAVKLRDRPAFRDAYGQMTHVTADGNPIVWLQRLAGAPVELLTGSDMLEPIIALAARQGVPMGFYGSTPDILARAKDILTARYPGLKIAACISPPMGFDPASDAGTEAVRQIGASGAQLWVVALGAPKQEILAARIAAAYPDLGVLCFGAGLDFIAGHQTRAPQWVRRLALEWLWRMMSNPGRLARRYGECALILPSLTRRALQARSNVLGKGRTP